MGIKKESLGVTLVELMVIVAILSIMAAQVVPKFADQMRRSTESSTKASFTASNISRARKEFFKQNRRIGFSSRRSNSGRTSRTPNG